MSHRIGLYQEELDMHRKSSLGYLLRASALCAAASLPACQDPRGPATVHSDDPDLKITAIKSAVASHNQDDIAKMVDDLQSDDAAVRFYSIQGLRRLTSDDFGYRFYETDEQRAPATKLWQNWLKKRQGKHSIF